MSKDGHTSHFVLFYEMSVFLENKEILSLTKHKWPFLGNYCSGPFWDGSGAERAILGDFPSK